MIVKRIGAVYLHDIVQLLALSRFGLREFDLQKILSKECARFSPIQFYNMINYLNALFVLRNDGRFDFFHKCMREGITESMNKEEMKEKKVQLLEHFKGLQEKDPIRQQELVFHMIVSDDKNGYVKYIGELMVQDKKDELRSVAITTYQMALKDFGKWLSELIKEKADDYVLNFLNQYLTNSFKDSDIELEIVEKILLAADERIIKLLPLYALNFDEKKTLKNQYRYVIETNENIGKLYERNNEEKFRERAMSYYESAYSVYLVFSKVGKPLFSEEMLLELGYRCRDNLGRILEKSGFTGEIVLGKCISLPDEDKNLNSSLAYFREALEFAKKIEEREETEKSAMYVADSYRNVGRVYGKSKGFFENLQWIRNLKTNMDFIYQMSQEMLEYYEKAQFYYHLAFERRKKDDIGSAQMIWEADVLQKSGEVLFSIEGVDNQEKAMLFFRNAFELYENAFKIDNSFSNRFLVATAYERYGDTLKLEKENIRQDYNIECMKAYESAFVIYKQLVDNVQSKIYENAFGSCAQKLISIYRYKKGFSDIHRASEICNICSEMYEAMLQWKQDEKLVLKASKNLTTMAEILERNNRMPGTSVHWKHPEQSGVLTKEGILTEVETLDLAPVYDLFSGEIIRIKEVYEKSVKIVEMFSKDSFLLQDVYCKMGDFYRYLNNFNYFGKAIEWYQKSILVWDNIIESDRQFRTYIMRSKIYQKMAVTYYSMKTQDAIKMAEKYCVKALKDENFAMEYPPVTDYSIIYHKIDISNYLSWINTLESNKKAFEYIEKIFSQLLEVQLRTSHDREMLSAISQKIVEIYTKCYKRLEESFCKEERKMIQDKIQDIQILYVNRKNRMEFEEKEKVLEALLRNPHAKAHMDVRTLSYESARIYQSEKSLRNLYKAKELLVKNRKYCEEWIDNSDIAKRGRFVEEAWCYEADAYLKIAEINPSKEVFMEALYACNEALTVFEESEKFGTRTMKGAKGINIKHRSALHRTMGDILLQINSMEYSSKREKMIVMHYEKALQAAEEVQALKDEANHLYNVIICLERIAMHSDNIKADQYYDRIYDRVVDMLTSYREGLSLESIEKLFVLGEKIIDVQKKIQKEIGIIYQIKKKKQMLDKANEIKELGKQNDVYNKQRRDVYPFSIREYSF